MNKNYQGLVLLIFSSLSLILFNFFIISLFEFLFAAPNVIILTETNKTPASINNSFVKPVIKSAIAKEYMLMQL